MKVLVTGSCGQLGTDLLLLSSKSKNEYLFTDLHEDKNISSLDITKIDDVEKVVFEYRPNVIVNCAAYTNVEEGESNEKLADLINNQAVSNLVCMCDKYGIKLIHISTDYVFDGKKNTPYKETDKACPLNVYGKTKLKGESVILENLKDFLIIRTSWLYSKWGKNFCKNIINLSQNNSEVKVVIDQVGSPTYSEDLARFIYKIIENNKLSISGLYHYSNLGVASWYDFAKAIFDIKGINTKILPCLSSEFITKAVRPEYSVLDKEKIMRDFNIDIPYWRDSLIRCLER